MLYIVIAGFLVIAGGFYFLTRNQSSDIQPDAQAGGNNQEQSQHKLVAGMEFAKELQAQPEAVVLDVRTPAEFGSGHVANARNLDFYDSGFSTQLDALDKSKHYFIYCRSGSRSAQAVRIMKQLGFSQITELSGGIAGNPGLVQ